MTDMRRKVSIEGEVAAHLIATHIGAQRHRGKNGEDEAEAKAGSDGAMTRGVRDGIGVGIIEETIPINSVGIRKAGRIPVNVTVIEG